MANNTFTNDDDIDIVELIQIFLKHKTKYIFFGLAGLILGLVFSFHHEQRFVTKFKLHIGHPALQNNFLINSIEVQDVLNQSELNNNLLPLFTLNKKTKIFSVVTDSTETRPIVSKIISKALDTELSTLKNSAKNFNQRKNQPSIIINNHSENNNDNNLVTWTNEDIANLDTNEVMQSLRISYGETKTLSPKPLKHAVIGIFIGLVMAFAWMITGILVAQLRNRS